MASTHGMEQYRSHGYNHAPHTTATASVQIKIQRVPLRDEGIFPRKETLHKPRNSSGFLQMPTHTFQSSLTLAAHWNSACFTSGSLQHHWCQNLTKQVPVQHCGSQHCGECKSLPTGREGVSEHVNSEHAAGPHCLNAKSEWCRGLDDARGTYWREVLHSVKIYYFHNIHASFKTEICYLKKIPNS